MNTFKVAFIFSLLILIMIRSNGQKSKFGEVTLEELKDTVHQYEMDAKAALIYQQGKASNQGGRLKIDIYRKIKIYDSKLSGWDDFGVLLYRSNRGNTERIHNLVAYTYNIENNKIVKSKLNKDEVFTDYISDNLREEKFAMPNVKDGSIIEYRYQIFSPFSYRVPKWNFQYEIPCNESDYYLEFPSYYKYFKREYGITPLVSKSSSRSAGQASMNGQNVLNTVEYNTKYVPSLVDVPFLLDINEYRLSVEYQRKTTWDNVALGLKSSKYFGRQLKKPSSPYKTFIEEVKLLPVKERAEKIYSKVQADFTWNKKYGKYTDNGVDKLSKERIGNIADINLLLINLLNKADIKTYPIVSQRRAEGPLNELFPGFSELNYVFGMIAVGDLKAFVDATDKFITFGELPLRAINTNGILLKKVRTTSIDQKANKGLFMKIENPNSKEISSYNLVHFSEDFDLKCNESVKYIGTAASSKRRSLSSYSSKYEFIGKLEERNSNYSIDSIKILNKEILSKPLQINYSYTLNGNVDEISGKLYINALLGNGVQKNPFVSEERRFPIYFDSKMKENYIISFKIPEGYEVDYLPETVNIGIPNKMGSYYFNLQVTGSIIQVHSRFLINEAVLSPQYFLSLKKLYDKAIEIGHQKIVLKKVD
jgi:hypothetical protein